MNAHFFKRTALLLVLLTLLLCLCGCEQLDYREAVELYNNRNYTRAAEIFSALGDYENSADLLTRCHYWTAVDTMEAGDWESALTQFRALEGYQDSEKRITECTYRLAVLAFENGDYAAAEGYFLEIPDYKQTSEYLRQLRWQKLYDYIVANGAEGGGCFVLSEIWEDRTVNLMVDMVMPGQIQLYISNQRDAGYTFSDSLSVTLTRDSFQADFTGTSTFAMDFTDRQIGSEQITTGAVNIAAITPEVLPAAQSFEMTVADNQGNTSTSQDPADSRMEAEMAENWRILFTGLPQYLLDHAVGITLVELGFTNLGV